MSFASKGVLQIDPLSFRKQSLDIMVTFSNNSLREINTRLSLLRFLIHEELMEYLIYCTRSNEVSSFSLKSNHKFYKYASVVQITKNFVHSHVIFILMKTEYNVYILYIFSMDPLLSI